MGGHVVALLWPAIQLSSHLAAVPSRPAAMPDAIEERKWKYVVWHKATGRRPGFWVASVSSRDHSGKIRSKSVGGRFTDQQSAAQAAADYLDISVDDLLLNRTDSCQTQVSHYKNVQFDRINNTWRAFANGQRLGARKEAHQAAQLAAEALNCEVGDLVKKAVATLHTVVEAVGPLSRIRSGQLPGDLQCAVEHMETSKSMFASEPALELVSVLGKYGPFKDLLFKLWQRRQRSRVPAHQQSSSPAARRQRSRVLADQQSSSPAARAKELLKLLKEAALSAQHLDEKVWNLNCGRKVAKVLGWLPLLSTHIRCVRHITEAQALRHEKAGTTVFRLGMHGNPYVWATEDESACIDRLSRLVLAADALAGVLTEPPRTASQWLNQYDEVVEVP